MRVLNCTHWRTDHLRAFVQRVAQVELDPERRCGFTVRVKYNRAGTRHAYCSGHAPYHGRHIVVMVPSGTVDRVDLAHVIAHEMAHSRGMRHTAMKVPRYRRMGNWREVYAWAGTPPLERTAPRPRVSADDRRAKRLQHAQAKLAEWTRRLKAAGRRVQQWRGRVRRLERTIAVAADRLPMAEKELIDAN